MILTVAELLVAYASWALLPWALLRAFRDLSWPDAVRDRQAQLGVLAAILVQQALLWTVIPQAAWHPNAHDLILEPELTQSGWFSSVSLAPVHGHSQGALYRVGGCPGPVRSRPGAAQPSRHPVAAHLGRSSLSARHRRPRGGRQLAPALPVQRH